MAGISYSNGPTNGISGMAFQQMRLLLIPFCIIIILFRKKEIMFLRDCFFLSVVSDWI